MNTVLVVEDDEKIRKLVVHLMEREGYETIEAGDGNEGLERARADHPDLILLDVMMPKRSGFEVARMLRFDEEYSQIPILMLSARTAEEDVNTGLETGADRYIKKPFNNTELIETVKEMLSEASA